MIRIKALPWTRLHQFLHDNHGVRYFVAAVGILLATGLTVVAWMWQQPVAQVPTIFATAQPDPEPPK